VMSLIVYPAGSGSGSGSLGGPVRAERRNGSNSDAEHMASFIS
jgi:hypothetical protein